MNKMDYFSDENYDGDNEITSESESELCELSDDYEIVEVYDLHDLLDHDPSIVNNFDLPDHDYSLPYDCEPIDNNIDEIMITDPMFGQMTYDGIFDDRKVSSSLICFILWNCL